MAHKEDRFCVEIYRFQMVRGSIKLGRTDYILIKLYLQKRGTRKIRRTHNP